MSRRRGRVQAIPPCRARWRRPSRERFESGAEFSGRISRARISGPRRRPEFIRMIGTAHHRAAGDVRETQLFGQDLISREILRSDEFDDRQMLKRGLEILPEREQIASGAAKVGEGGEQFIFLFAEAKHQAGFGEQVCAATGFGLGEHTERAIVGGAGANGGSRAGGRFRGCG